MEGKCPSCFTDLVPEVVQILQGQRYTPEAKWVDSTVQRCSACKHTYGGTLEDRLAYVRSVYEYKYFGDYELSDEQNDAVWSAKALAELVPDLVEALKALVENLGNPEGTDRDKVRPQYDAALAALSKALSPGEREEGKS